MLNDDRRIMFEKRNHDMWIEKGAIYYIQADGSYIDIYTINGKKKTSHTLQYWMEKIDDEMFVRIHKSYIVNARYVKSVGKTIQLNDGKVLPIGRSYKENLKKRIMLLKQTRW